MLHDTCYVRRGFTLQNFSKKNLGGFTLIELILYVGLAAVMILAVSIFLSTMLQSRVRNQTVLEVESQGIQVMQIVTQAGRNANSIDFTTSFDLSQGVIIMNDGSGPVALTNSRVVASNLTFQNLSRTDTPGTIRIQFTLTHINPSERNEYDFSKTFYGSATLR